MFTLKKKDLFAYACLAIAVLAFIFAIVCFATNSSASNGSYESSKSYGGDAYTGIQNAAAQTANNVYYLSKNIQTLTACVATASGFFFLLVALIFALVGVKKLGLLECAFKEEVAAPVAQVEAAAPAQIEAAAPEFVEEA